MTTFHDYFLVSEETTEAPCVGMCYYKKLMGLEEKENEEKLQNEVIEVKKNSMA